MALTTSHSPPVPTTVKKLTLVSRQDGQLHSVCLDTVGKKGSHWYPAMGVACIWHHWLPRYRLPCLCMSRQSLPYHSDPFLFTLVWTAPRGFEGLIHTKQSTQTHLVSQPVSALERCQPQSLERSRVFQAPGFALPITTTHRQSTRLTIQHLALLPASHSLLPLPPPKPTPGFHPCRKVSSIWRSCQAWPFPVDSSFLCWSPRAVPQPRFSSTHVPKSYCELASQTLYSPRVYRVVVEATHSIPRSSACAKLITASSGMSPKNQRDHTILGSGRARGSRMHHRGGKSFWSQLRRLTLRGVHQMGHWECKGCGRGQRCYAPGPWPPNLSLS